MFNNRLKVLPIYSYLKNYAEVCVLLILKIVLPKPLIKNRNIFFVNTGQIGDLLVSSLIFENEEHLSSFGKIVFLIKEEYFELFRQYKGKIEILTFNYKNYRYNIFYKYKLLKKIRYFGLDTSVNLSASRGILNDEITILSGSEQKYCLNNGEIYLGKRLSLKINKYYSNIIALEKNNEYDKHLAILLFFNRNKKLNLNWNSGRVFRNLHSVQSIKDGYIVIAPFSSAQNRDWKVDYFRKVIYNLSTQFKIYLIGTIEQLPNLMQISGNVNNVQILSKGLKIADISFLLSKALVFIGLDSGISHLALKLDVPLVSIIGGGNYSRFFPYKENERVKYLYYPVDCFGCRWKCIHKEKFCLTNITPEKVVDNVLKVIKSNYVDFTNE